MDAQVAQIGDIDPLSSLGLCAVLAGLPGQRSGVEAHGELLADLTVVVGHDVARAGVKTHESGDLDGDAGFLDRLADGGVQNGFTKIDGAARKRPAVIVAAAISAVPGLPQRLLTEHVPRADGRCVRCTIGGQAGNQHWPCRIHGYASMAAAIAEPARHRR